MNKTIKVNTRHHPRKKLLKQITKTYNKFFFFFFNSSRVSFIHKNQKNKLRSLDMSTALLWRRGSVRGMVEPSYHKCAVTCPHSWNLYRKDWSTTAVIFSMNTQMPKTQVQKTTEKSTTSYVYTSRHLPHLLKLFIKLLDLRFLKKSTIWCGMSFTHQKFKNFPTIGMSCRILIYKMNNIIYYNF